MRVFHAPSHNFLMPVVFVNGWEKEHREFLDNYDPREGFYLYKEKEYRYETRHATETPKRNIHSHNGQKEVPL